MCNKHSSLSAKIRKRRKKSYIGSATAGLYFTDILRADFLSKSVLRRFTLITVWLCNLLATYYRLKSCSLNIGEIDHGPKLGPLRCALEEQLSTRNRKWALIFLGKICFLHSLWQLYTLKDFYPIHPTPSIGKQRLYCNSRKCPLHHATTCTRSTNLQKPTFEIIEVKQL